MLRIRWLLRWTLRALFLTVLGGFLLVWLAPSWVLPPVADFLDVSESPHPTDYVMVLNGDWNIRPFAAAAIYRVGLAREVLLTTQRATLESGAVQDGRIPSELEITLRVLRARGVPDEAVRVLPAAIASTHDEARALADFLADRPDATVAVVTNSFHTRRARWIFRRALGDKLSNVSFVGVPRDRVDAQTWWRSSEGCKIYLSEYGKFLYYWVRY